MKFIYSLIVLLMLSGCATHGNKTLRDTSLYSNIQPHNSTKVDVYNNFGIPSDVKFDGEVWEYAAVRTRWSAWTFVSPLTAGIVENRYMTVFYFNSENILQDYKTFNTPKDYRNSLLTIGKALPRIKDCKTEMQETGDRVRQEFVTLDIELDEKRFRRERYIDCMNP